MKHTFVNSISHPKAILTCILLVAFLGIMLNATAATTLYTVSAPDGTDICPGIGKRVKLSGSQSDHTYQLWQYGTLRATLSGNGSALYFTNCTLTYYSYTIKAINSSGIGTIMSGSVTFTLRSNPIVTVNGNTAICPRGTAIWTPAGASSYSWSPQTDLTYIPNGTVQVMPTAARTYSITGTNSYGCTASITKTVTLQSDPTPTITPASAEICTGGSVTLTASGAGYYTWTPTTGLSASTGSVVIASPSLTTTYTVTGSHQGGCTGSRTITVTVKPKPAVFTLQSVGGTEFCEGSVGKELKISGSQTGVSYLLSFYGQTQATVAGTGSSVSFGQFNDDNYQYTASASWSAGLACATSMNGSIQLIESPPPVLAINGLSSVCKGSSTIWTPSGASSYSWSPQTDLFFIPNGTISVTPTASRTYTITGTSSVGCTNTITKSISINDPTPIISPATAEICSGSSDTLTATNASAQSFTWSPSTGLSSTAGSNVIASPAVTTIYTVTGSNQGGCSGSRTVTVTVKSKPAIYSLQSVGGIEFCANAVGKELKMNGGQSGVSYSLLYQNQIITTVPSTGSSVSFGTYNSNGYPYTASAKWTSGPACPTNMSGSIQFIKNPLPTLSVSGQDNFCLGDGAIWTLSGANSYSWEPLTDLDDIAGNHATIRLFATRDYTISGTDSKGCIGTITKRANLNCPYQVVSPSLDKNFIHTTTTRSPMSASTLAAIQSGTSTASSDQLVDDFAYFDGLGRPLQEILVASAPFQKDLISFHEYDDFGREAVSYLPFSEATSAGDKGSYMDDPKIPQVALYTTLYGSQDGTNAFSEQTYDDSPLNRVIYQSAPGYNWRKYDGHEINYKYLTNNIEIKRWTTSEELTGISSSSEYEIGTLYINQVMDENGAITREYTDNEGKLLLKENVLDTTTNQTYYVYNNLGLLRAVIPPAAVGINNSDYCYYYKYDARNRMTVKKIPGADSILMVYDQRNRLIAVQDGNQRQLGKWIITKYDGLNRPVITAEYSRSITRPDLQLEVDAYTSEEALNLHFVNFSGNLHGYSRGTGLGNNITESDVLTVTYYDKYYTIDSDNNLKFKLPNATNLAQGKYTGFVSTASSRTKGNVTLSKIRVGLNSFLRSINYYDEYGRVVQTVSENHVGGIDRVSTWYNFVNEVQASIHEHSSTNANLVEASRFENDHRGRLINEFHQIAGNSERALSNYTYNTLGQLTQKGLCHSQQKMDYSYNIRGWITKINDIGTASANNRLFSMRLFYDQAPQGITTGFTAQHNGNIGAISWRTPGNTAMSWTSSQQNYLFQYDKLNRLLSANYSEGNQFNTSAGAYSENSITYDPNGNILNLTRYNGVSQQIDLLAYNYLGNQLNGVTDNAPLAFKAEGFTDGNSGSQDYGYDKNGNLLYDANKGISNLQYNYMNLPVSMNKEGNTISYLYDAAGGKRRFTSNGHTIDYDGNIVYRDGQLSYLLTTEGKVDLLSGTWRYEYFLKDHLGNTRIAFNEDAPTTASQINDYYPFGLIAREYRTDCENKYLYNGKELQEGTDWYDYGARMYDANLGRWHSADPHAEDYLSVSPYCYALNNPILCVDPDGKDVVNADEERLNKAENKKERTQREHDKAKTGHEIRKTQRKLNQATRQYNRAYTAYQQTDQAIQKIAETSPETFDKLNNLTDPYGNTIDVVVTSGDDITHNQQGAQNLWDYNENTCTIIGVLPGGDETKGRENTILVRLQKRTSDPDIKLVHEGGHLIDMIRDPMYYKNNRGDNQERDCRDPSVRNKQSVKTAMDLEESYINIRNGKK